MKNQPKTENSTAKHVPAAINGEKLTAEQIAAVKEFIEQLGGIENARRAVAALSELKKAA
jgi:alkylhydroperoxidase/carboxymuconolactone decarboxylase family protein YurZ